MRIPSKDFIDVCDTNAGVGTTWHINHDNCTAGVDTRKRLYITRMDDNSFVAYCHNCAGWGVVKAKQKRGEWVKYVPRNKAAEAVENVDVTPEPLPEDVTLHTAAWPQEVCDWVAKYYIMDPSTRRFTVPEYSKFFAYSKKLDRLIIAVTAADNKSYFWQGRDCTGRSSLKYYTGVNQHKGLIRIKAKDGPSGKTLFITEDLTSAIRIAQTGHDVIPLCGTSVHDFPEFVNNCKEYALVAIWLDNDKAGWHAMLALHQRLALFGIKAHVLYGLAEPKTFSPEKLKEMTDGC